MGFRFSNLSAPRCYRSMRSSVKRWPSIIPTTAYQGALFPFRRGCNLCETWHAIVCSWLLMDLSRGDFPCFRIRGGDPNVRGRTGRSVVPAVPPFRLSLVTPFNSFSPRVHLYSWAAADFGDVSLYIWGKRGRNQGAIYFAASLLSCPNRLFPPQIDAARWGRRPWVLRTRKRRAQLCSAGWYGHLTDRNMASRFALWS